MQPKIKHSPIQIDRDLTGYGPNLPHPNWPHKARVAINFMPIYEEGAERSPIYGDESAENFTGEVVLEPLPKGVRFLVMESIFEYGSRAGFWRLMRLFEKYKISTTVMVTGFALQFNRPAAEYLAQSSHEIAGHGWRYINYGSMPIEEERKHIELCIQALEDLTGKRPLGWATGRCSLNTRRLLAEIGGFLYDSDSFADDLPYYQLVNGKKHLIIPYSLDCNDSRFVLAPGFACSQDFFQHLKDTFDTYYQEGEKHPSMMTIPLHYRIAGRPGRTAALERFIQYILQFKDIWICRREEIAHHWLKQFP